MSRPRSARRVPAPRPEIIGFRLDPESRRILAERAARLGVSVHDLARDYVFEAVHAREDRAALVESLQAIHQAVTKVRGDVATTAEALLIRTGGVEADEARAWIEHNFK